jgi:hypothetical protein
MFKRESCASTVGPRRKEKTKTYLMLTLEFK